MSTEIKVHNGYSEIHKMYKDYSIEINKFVYVGSTMAFIRKGSDIEAIIEDENIDSLLMKSIEWIDVFVKEERMEKLFDKACNYSMIILAAVMMLAMYLAGANV